ncbi:hypothetical protein [Pseudomonas sp. B21-048]|uniref:hypothetical protein n=1 Tax=Pseudomonas sp. B21-048 TaxID=2895490 RepID=UPI00215EDA75|nr:hypothetical protein [Pseudomonas sp. B21-048]UVL01453.1 hypothetical protein LOY56_24425 [Pseudomonas sp. B21-048]
MNTAAAFADFRTYPLISALTAVHTWRTAFKCSDTFMTDSQAKKNPDQAVTGSELRRVLLRSCCARVTKPS